MNFIPFPFHYSRKSISKIDTLSKMLIAVAIALALALIAGCYGSQVQCVVRIGILTWDSRPVSEILQDDATNFTAKASEPKGIASGAKVNTDTLQSMVLWKSPVTATSNSTPISVDIPLVK